MWTLTFKDINDATITVEIEGGNGTLTGAAEPLITRELETDDPFEPVRYQTGYINLVGTDGADIRPTDTFDRPVTIKKNGAIVWLGYIAVEEWNNSMSEYPQTVQLPLISALGVLDYVEYQAEAAQKTIGQVLYKALNTAPRMFYTVNFGGHTPDVFRHTINDLAFDIKTDKHEHYAGVNPDMPSRRETYSALDVVREICKMYGWQLREDGQSLYFSTADSGASYLSTSLDAIATNPTGTANSGQARTLSPVSTALSRSILLSKNQVRITLSKHKMDDEIISLENIIKRLVFHQEYNTPSVITPEVKFYFSDIYYPDDDVAIIRGDLGESVAINLVGDQLLAREPSQMRYKGALLCADTYVGHENPSEEDMQTKPCLTITEYSRAFDAAILISENTYYFSPNEGGSIDLTYEANAISYYDEKRWPTDEEKEMAAGVPPLTCKLQFGNVWYNGSEWQSSETDFNLQQVDSNVNATTWRHNCKGKRIPLPVGHSGKFKLTIQTPYGINQSVNKLKYVRFTDLSLIMRPLTFTTAITSDDELRYNASCNPYARDTYEMKSELYFLKSDTADQAQSYNKIYVPGEYPINSVLSRMQAWYNKAHMRIQVDARGTDFKPMDTASFNSYNCIIGARQVNWRDAQTRLTLYSK